MVLSTQPAEHAAANTTVAETLLNSDFKVDQEKLALMSVLQSTLDLRTQLRYFLDALRQKLKIDGLFYTEEKRQIKIKIGRLATHSCGYNLSNSGEPSGEIIFKRSTRFKDSELETIEQSILLLLMPLKNALTYKDAAERTRFNPNSEVMERPALLGILNREIELAKRHNHPLSLISIRVNVSSNMEKLEIEKTLRPLCHSFQALGDSTDLWLRLGPAEFFVLRYSSLGAARKFAMELEHVEKASAYAELTEADVLVSAGVASLTGTDSINSLINRAQNAAKQSLKKLV